MQNEHLTPALSPFCFADSAKRGEGENHIPLRDEASGIQNVDMYFSRFQRPLKKDATSFACGFVCAAFLAAAAVCIALILK